MFHDYKIIVGIFENDTNLLRGNPLSTPTPILSPHNLDRWDPCKLLPVL